MASLPYSPLWLICFLDIAPLAIAAASDERAQLVLITSQLRLIYQITDRAEAADHADARFRFDYHQLRADLRRIEGGLQNYLVPPRAQPADPTPLNGQYRIDQDVEVTP